MYNIIHSILTNVQRVTSRCHQLTAVSFVKIYPLSGVPCRAVYLTFLPCGPTITSTAVHLHLGK